LKTSALSLLLSTSVAALAACTAPAFAAPDAAQTSTAKHTENRLLAGKYYLIAHPDDTRTLAAVGYLEIELNAFTSAVKHLSRAIELAPFQNAYYIDRAEAYLHSGEYKKAIDDTNVVMKSTVGAEVGLALATRGECYYRLGNYKQAAADLTRAIHYLPDLGSTYFYRGQSYYKLGRKDLASADIEMARQRNFAVDGQREYTRN
jgi:tetratricopeptide (TPR) repeat protein